MYLTACLDQPLHYAGEGMVQDYRLTDLVMGNGATGHKGGKRDPLVHAYHSLFRLLTAALFG